MKNWVYTLLIVVVFCQLSFSQFTNTDIVGKLKVETTNNISKVIATVSNTTEVYFSLRYVFSIIHYDSDNNSSKESREDLFAIDPSETKELHKAFISIENENKIIVLLLIYDENDKLIGKDRVVFNSSEKDDKTVKEKPRDGLVLLGILADETKTKFGKDFYDYFSLYYNYNNIKGEKIVKILEIVSFRRNTQIQVIIEDEIIFQFFSKPDNEFLEQMSKSALQKVYQYFQKLKKENTYIRQY